MSAQNPSIIGMNHPAFQVSKSDLIAWVEGLIGVNIKKVENGKDAVIYADLLKILYGNEMKTKKIKRGVKTEYDFEKNWKLVQDLLTKKGVTKPIPVNKIMKGKFQDNLEFLQWFKHYFEYVQGADGGGGSEQKTSGKKKVGLKKTQTATKPKKKKLNKKKGSVAKTEKAQDPGDGDGDELSKLQLSIEGLEKERNFYFSKLREIEVMCQADPEADWAKKILEVLYQTDDAEEFQQPEDGVVNDETF